jgi:hypothetical protein
MKISLYGAQFTKYLDVLSIPKRTLLEQLSFYAADAEQAEKCVRWDCIAILVKYNVA